MKYLKAQRKAAPGAPENKALSGPQANKTAEGLGSLSFASAAARERAEALNLWPEAFAKTEPSSERGFTVADVERVAEATSDA